MLTAHPQAALSPVRVRNLVPECLKYSAFTDTCQGWLHFHRLHYFSAPKFFYCCEKKKPFTYSKFKYVDYPRSCLPSILCRGKNLIFFPLPLPIFDLVHVQYVQFIWSFRYWWTAGYQNSFYPMYNWITDEENSCYPNSSLPENRWYWSIISLHAHAPCLS